ncbi:hypothetical protein ACQ4M4_00225 [Leptolyngbya sp. AN02str]|uniref:hypothetical protein n=1 Tax=Leptolyngbya sp. AN02str TaxID=3423363 RepID=UPI003D3139A7
MAETYITSKQLIETLQISSDKLLEVQKFFDSIPDDEWELNEGKDYRIVNGAGLREYTQSGAYTIARYLESNQQLNLFEKLKDWFTGYRKKIRQSFIRKKITDNCSSLIKRRDQFWISRADTVAIFGTRSDYLSKMAEHTQKSENPLIKGQDYDEFMPGEGIYYSLTGIFKLSQSFSKRLTRKNRKEECKDVGHVISSQVEDIVKQILNRQSKMEKALKQAKRRDGKKCLVTGKRSNSIESCNLVAHHLYSKSEYPHIADCLDNLITISEEVHKQFHEHYMGGYHKPCALNDFIQFMQQYYPDNYQLVNWLEGQKRKLGDQKEIKTKPHVLYLPASRVS